MARPTKRTPERVERLLAALRAGNTRRAACHAAGITTETLGQWLASFPEFSDGVKSAESAAERRMVGFIAEAASSGTWTAAAWWLERRRPDDYGRRERVDITVRQTAERLGAELGIDPDELIREAERIVRG